LQRAWGEGADSGLTERSMGGTSAERNPGEKRGSICHPGKYLGRKIQSSVWTLTEGALRRFISTRLKGEGGGWKKGAERSFSKDHRSSLGGGRFENFDGGKGVRGF